MVKVFPNKRDFRSSLTSLTLDFSDHPLIINSFEVLKIDFDGDIFRTLAKACPAVFNWIAP
jgi:hypothetical protein